MVDYLTTRVRDPPTLNVDKKSNWAIACAVLGFLFQLGSLIPRNVILYSGAALGYRGFEYQYALSLVEINVAANDKNWRLSMYYLIRSARKNYAPAQYELSCRLDEGRGVVQDAPESARYLKLAADQGLAEAQFRYGLLLYRSVVNGLYASVAAEYLRLAAGQGFAEALSEFGKHINEGASVLDWTGVVQYFERAADRGVSYAQFAFGLFLVSCKKYVQGAKYLKLSADQNNSEGEFWYGKCLRDGKGVPQNRAAAQVYLNRSAHRGNEDARRASAALLKATKLDRPTVGMNSSEPSIYKEIEHLVLQRPSAFGLRTLILILELCFCAVYIFQPRHPPAQ
jgi:TPR repeat protein